MNRQNRRNLLERRDHTDEKLENWRKYRQNCRNLLVDRRRIYHQIVIVVLSTISPMTWGRRINSTRGSPKVLQKLAEYHMPWIYTTARIYPDVLRSLPNWWLKAMGGQKIYMPNTRVGKIHGKICTGKINFTLDSSDRCRIHLLIWPNHRNFTNTIGTLPKIHKIWRSRTLLCQNSPKKRPGRKFYSPKITGNYHRRPKSGSSVANIINTASLM